MSARRHRRGSRHARAATAGRGFTLIELLAVLLMFGLLASIALPNLSLGGRQQARGEAEKLAASLEFARQRAVVTGAPHRVTLDLDEGRYWTEWFVSEARALGQDEPEEAAPPPPRGDGDEIDLSPPTVEDEAYRPLPGEMGAPNRLSRAVALIGAETSAGRTEGGRLEIVFAFDGTAEPADLLLASEEGSRMVLSVGALSDTVRIRHGSL